MFAEKQRAVELEDKKVKKHGLHQQGRTNQPLLRTIGGPPPRHPSKSTSGISSVVSQNPRKIQNKNYKRSKQFCQSIKNQQYHIPPRISH